MGEVYRARDTRLGRDVAVKVLPAEFAMDPERLRRFEQEARATAALDHPNILAVFDIGTHEGTPYIVEQLLEGESLRDRLRGGPLTPAKAVEYAIQITQGLAAAHEKGIVHRDLKPENLFVTKEGRIKILDFGLARLRLPESEHAEGRSEAATADSPTREGRVLGTPGYMAPEQIRGHAADARSDIFAFGTVLYEMLAGRKAFEGATHTDIAAAILKEDPVPLPSGVPPVLAQLVRRCLEKRPQDRFSSAQDLAFALEAVSGSGAAVITPTTGAQVVIPRSRLWIGGTAVALLLIAGGISVALYFGRGRKAAPQPFEHTKVTRITGDGRAGEGVAISPDGRYVAYVLLDDQNRPGLWVQQVATSNAVPLVTPSADQLREPAFSRDGNYVYYLFRPPERAWWQLYRVPSIGGVPEPQPIQDVDSAVTFSPDGDRLAFVRGTPQGNQLLIESVDGTAEKVLALGGRQRRPSWSQDGRTIAWLGREGDSQFIQLVDARTGAARPLGEKRWGWTGGVDWLPGGKGLLLTAGEKAGSNHPAQLWLVGVPSGEVRTLMSDVASYGSLSLSSDGRSLACAKYDEKGSLWTAPLEDFGKAVQVGHASYSADGGNALAWTPSGALIYSSTAGDQQDLWIAERPGAPPRRLTNDPVIELNAAVSPDGHTIVFLESLEENARGQSIWRIDMDGSGRRLLVPPTGKGIFRPILTGDGRSVVYYAEEEIYAFTGRPYRVPIDGGTSEPLGAGDPVKLKRFEGFMPLALSSDGRTLAGLCRQGQRLAIATMPLDGSSTRKTVVSPEGTWVEMAFAPDGRSLVYHDYRSTIWRQPLDGAPARKLVDLPGKRLYNLAVWIQGQRVAYTVGAATRDVVLIQDTGSDEDMKR